MRKRFSPLMRYRQRLHPPRNGQYTKHLVNELESFAVCAEKPRRESAITLHGRSDLIRYGVMASGPR